MSGWRPCGTLLEEYCAEHGLKLNAEIETRTQSAAEALVAQGAEFTVIDKIAAESLGERTACFALNPPLKWQFQLLSRKKLKAFHGCQYVARLSKENAK